MESPDDYLDAIEAMFDGVLESNKTQVEEFVAQVLTKHPRCIGMVGLAFKPRTDDMRESPYVAVAKRLIGEGIKLRIFDPSVDTSRLIGSNKEAVQAALAQHFGVMQDEVTGTRTYGGHGEMMAVFASTAKISGKPLTDLIGTEKLTEEAWEELKGRVRQGGKRIIQLRGRSSFQSPAHQSVLMVKAVIDGKGYPWPCGTYIDSPDHGLEKVMMAMETRLTREGVSWSMPDGTDDEIAALRASYEHLTRLRDEVVEMGVLPPLDRWTKANPNL